MGQLNAGDLNQRVRLLRAQAEPDGRGGSRPNGPDLVREAWAAVRTLRAAEKLALGQTLVADVVQVTLRREPAADAPAPQRVGWRGATYAVQVVEVDSRNEYVLLTCYNSGQ